MEKFICLISALVLAGNFVCGQQKKTVTITSGTETGYEQILPAGMLYEFAEFIPAKLYFNNRSVAEHQVNYNLVSGALLFKDKSGRILEYAYPEQIKTFVIRDTFWIPAEKGFGKIIYSSDKLDLVKCRHTECTDIRKEGAFGGISSTASVTSVTSFQGGDNKRYSLTVPGEYDFEVKIFYYIRKNGQILPVNGKNLKKLFPGKKNHISRIMKSQHFNLDEEEDIINLVKLVQSN